jgi:hypothetical protein
VRGELKAQQRGMAALRLARQIERSLIMSVQYSMKPLQYSQMQRIDQNQLCDNNSCALEIYCLPTLVFQIIDPQHSWIHHSRKLRKKPFEGCEKRRIIESPF